MTPLDELILNENIDIAGKRVLLALKNELANKDVELAVKEKEIARLTNKYVDLAIKSMEGELADMKTKLANKDVESVDKLAIKNTKLAHTDSEIAVKDNTLANMKMDTASTDIRDILQRYRRKLHELQPRDIIGASSVMSCRVMSCLRSCRFQTRRSNLLGFVFSERAEKAMKDIPPALDREAKWTSYLRSPGGERFLWTINYLNGARNGADAGTVAAQIVGIYNKSVSNYWLGRPFDNPNGPSAIELLSTHVREFDITISIAERFNLRTRSGDTSCGII